MADHDEMDTEVGYQKPPRATQFQKGKSGNPSGRPKGSKNLHTIILQDARQLVKLNGPRGPRMIPKCQAAVMQLGNQAVQGYRGAAREYLTHVRLAEQAQQAKAGHSIVQQRDASVFANLLERLRRLDEGPISDSTAAALEQPDATEI